VHVLAAWDRSGEDESWRGRAEPVPVAPLATTAIVWTGLGARSRPVGEAARAGFGAYLSGESFPVCSLRRPGFAAMSSSTMGGETHGAYPTGGGGGGGERGDDFTRGIALARAAPGASQRGSATGREGAESSSARYC